MRALGNDFGEKHIGLAVSDPDDRWALQEALDRGKAAAPEDRGEPR
jgi:RNase H-fold protein (predicted Holliday junction resolvase)